jgi:hypothetical protein
VIGEECPTLSARRPFWARAISGFVSLAIMGVAGCGRVRYPPLCQPALTGAFHAVQHTEGDSGDVGIVRF